MSVIAVKVEKDKIVVGADTQLTWGDFKISQDGIKLFKIADDFIIGCAGLMRMGTLIRLFAQTTKPRSSNEMSILEFFQSFENWVREQTNNEIKDLSENQYLIIFCGKVYLFQEYYIQEVTKFIAIGSGSSKALTALALGFGIEDALKAVCKVDLYCHEPIVTFEMKRA